MGNNLCDFLFDFQDSLTISSLEEKTCSKRRNFFTLTLQVPETKTVEFANSIDLDEVAQN